MAETLTAFPILLVEDNPLDADLSKRAFSKGEPAVAFTLARDGEEALQMMEQWDAGVRIPSFILLDLKLPKVDGLQVLAKLKAHEKYRLIPVIVLTSSGEARDVQTAYKLGANSYIVKQIDYEKFLSSAQEIKHYWCHLNNLPIV